MTTQSYTVRLADGRTVKIDNVAKVTKDGAGMRLYDEDNSVLASFDDGQAKTHWPESATVTEPEEAGS